MIAASGVGNQIAVSVPLGGPFDFGGFEDAGSLLRGVVEVFRREADHFPCPEDAWAPGFEGRGAPEESVFIGLDAERIKSQVTGEADGTAAVEDRGE